MRKNILLLITALIFFGCSSTETKNARPPFEHFLIAFEQDGAILPVENHQVKLRRAPFAIIIYFTGTDSIFVHASPERKTLDLTAEGKPLSELPGFSESEIPENLYNRDETLFLSEKSPGFWKYTSEREHNFTSVKQENNVIVCRRIITSLTDHDADDRVTPLEKTGLENIFLSTIKMEWNEDYSKKIELKRRYFILSFIDSGKE